MHTTSCRALAAPDQLEASAWTWRQDSQEGPQIGERFGSTEPLSVSVPT